MLAVAGITIQFGTRSLFENVSVEFAEGNRYGLTGVNGKPIDNDVSRFKHPLSEIRDPACQGEPLCRGRCARLEMSIWLNFSEFVEKTRPEIATSGFRRDHAGTNSDERSE